MSRGISGGSWCSRYVKGHKALGAINATGLTLDQVLPVRASHGTWSASVRLAGRQHGVEDRPQRRLMSRPEWPLVARSRPKTKGCSWAGSGRPSRFGVLSTNEGRENVVLVVVPTALSRALPNAGLHEPALGGIASSPGRLTAEWGSVSTGGGLCTRAWSGTGDRRTDRDHHRPVLEPNAVLRRGRHRKRAACIRA